MKRGWARGSLLEQAGEFFLAQQLSSLFGVLYIAGAAVSPSICDGTQAGQLSSAFETYLQFRTPDPFGAGIGRTKINVR